MQAIVVQTFVAAPAEQVWEALFDRTDVLFDGLPAKQWPEGVERHVAGWHAHAPWPFTEAAGAATEVALQLHPMGEGTRLDVRHQGWGEGPAWDAAIQGHFAGWLQGLAAFGLLLETGRDARPAAPGLAARERYFVSGEIPASASDVYRSLTDPAIVKLWSDGALAGFTPAESVEDSFVRWRTASGEVTAILRRTPRGTHMAVAEYGVTDRSSSARWPGVFERLAKYLS
jgi:hypothetical protein